MSLRRLYLDATTHLAPGWRGWLEALPLPVFGWLERRRIHAGPQAARRERLASPPTGLLPQLSPPRDRRGGVLTSYAQRAPTAPSSKDGHRGRKSGWSQRSTSRRRS